MDKTDQEIAVVIRVPDGVNEVMVRLPHHTLSDREVRLGDIIVDFRPDNTWTPSELFPGSVEKKVQ